MRPGRAFHFSVASLFAFIALSCATVKIPADYVPDDKIVFLMQETSFGPIRYETMAADPYVFEGDSSPVDAVNPSFLKTAKFENLLKPDFKADSRLYREVASHFSHMLDLPLFAELRSTLDAADIRPADPLPLNKGEKIKDYSNGAEYRYPDAEGATITVLNTGTYVIHFADKTAFQRQNDGAYFWKDAADKTVQQYDPARNHIMTRNGAGTFVSAPDFRSYRCEKGTIEYHSEADPQYALYPADKAGALYTYFVDAEGIVISCSIKTASGIRFDFFPADQTMLAINGNHAVTIDPAFRKVHATFDYKTRTTGDVLSLYLNQGIRLTDLDASGPAHAELNPAWPEGYKKKEIGPFDVWYTAQDEAALRRINAERLADVESRVRSLSGLSGAKRRSIVIPPDLATYRKLHASEPGDRMSWYPSGFETLDYITMWPISVPRYTASAGQDYFFDHEIYEILAHEYTHVLVGENAGLLGQPPVWLNEGLALYVECQLFPDARKYWETTFDVSRDLRKLLPWDDVTVRSTGEYPIDLARVHYAQSYALVSRLIGAYGSAKVASYVKSFRVPSKEADKADLAGTYKDAYKKVFGTDWDDGTALLSRESPAKK